MCVLPISVNKACYYNQNVQRQQTIDETGSPGQQFCGSGRVGSRFNFIDHFHIWDKQTHRDSRKQFYIVHVNYFIVTF